MRERSERPERAARGAAATGEDDWSIMLASQLESETSFLFVNNLERITSQQGPVLLGTLETRSPAGSNP